MPIIDLEPLEHVELRASDDEVKTDLEVTCTHCGQHLCDAEHGDTLAVLIRAALDHTSCVGVPE